MHTNEGLDAVVVGGGPNGLAAAITLLQAGRSVLVVEAADEVGGGARSAQLTLPGYIHDVCSAIHPLAVGSPFLRSLPLERHGLRWINPEIALAHPLDGDRAGVLWHDAARTVAGLGRDGRAWSRWIAPLAAEWDAWAPAVLGPLLRMPRHPVTLARFLGPGSLPATLFARAFSTPEGRALFAGCAAHSLLPLEHVFTASFGLMFMAAVSAGGWPVAQGGSGKLSEALAGHVRELGGTIVTGTRVTKLAELPPSRVVLFDIAPRQVADIAGDRLPSRYARRLRGFRHGPGVFKVDYALAGPMPWRNGLVNGAGTVHIGGTSTEIAASEADVLSGRHPDRPFVLVGQQSVVDPTRAPPGQHTLWAYTHVPAGSTVDMTERIEGQIERYAPGFRDLVLARHTADSAWFEAHNPAYINGDIGGGSYRGTQIVFRPTVTTRPYATPDPSLFLCSASTPPGAGVHGMCGHHAARAALAGPLR